MFTVPPVFPPPACRRLPAFGGLFGVDGFAGGEDGFLAVDETVDVIDDLQIVRLAVHFGQRVEAFDDSAVGGIGFLAGRFGRAGDDGSLLAVAVGEEGDEFLIRFLQSHHPSFEAGHLETVRDVFQRNTVQRRVGRIGQFAGAFFFFRVVVKFFQILDQVYHSTVFSQVRQ